MSKHILTRFNELLWHLNSEDNDLAHEFYKELEKVSDKADFLECLEALGVDNWDGYDLAQEAYHNEG